MQFINIFVVLIHLTWVFQALTFQGRASEKEQPVYSHRDVWAHGQLELEGEWHPSRRKQLSAVKQF